MKRKITNSYLLSKSIIFISTFVAMLFVSYRINKNLFKSCKYQFKENTSRLIVGDSHCQEGIVENYIPNSENLSHYAEGWFSTFLKVKELTKRNKQIKVLITSISPQRFSGFYDLSFSLDKFSRETLERLYPILKTSEILNFQINWSVYMENFFRNIICPNINYLDLYINPSLNKYPFFEKASEERSVIRGNPQKINYKEKVNKYFGNQGFSKVDKFYLDSLINYCKFKELRLVFIDFPQPNKYLDLISKDLMQSYWEEIERLKGLDNVYYFNLQRSFEASLFKDHTHLNIIGAKKLSSIISLKLDSICNCSRSSLLKGS